MGQYWMLFNLTRGTYTGCGGIQLVEFSSDPVLHRNLTRALRPGGLWSGHRVLLSGDYDGNAAHVAAYLRAHGLALAADAPPELERPKNVYELVTARGIMGCTDDRRQLGWRLRCDAFPGSYTFDIAFAPLPRAEEAELAALAAAERHTAVSHDARQRLRLDGAPAWVALICLLSESSGAGGGDIEAPFRGDWAAHSVAVLNEADTLEYEDISSLLTPQWLTHMREAYHYFLDDAQP